MMIEKGNNVIVAIRLRPATIVNNNNNDKEKDYAGSNPETPSLSVKVTCGNCITLTLARRNDQIYSFPFDHCFDERASQKEIYQALGSMQLLDNALNGFNTCLFAYGQTGSGKTFSLTGSVENPGITPRICSDLFDRLAGSKIDIEASFFEIYNEKVKDLLLVGKTLNSKTFCRVRENPVIGPYVEGLRKVSVKCSDELVALIHLGNKNRAMAATLMNEHSSRSHSIFTISIRLEQGKVGKISLVDLAGSERVGHAGTSGDRLREGAKINQSLTALGLVIKALVAQSNNIGSKRSIHIPYRDSVLTWLLKESLGGNAKTVMLATINPLEEFSDESLSTLRYASQAKCIINNAIINEDPKLKLIRELRQEVERLKLELALNSPQRNMSSSNLAGKENAKTLEKPSIISLETRMDRLLEERSERLKSLGLEFINYEERSELRYVPRFINCKAKGWMDEGEAVIFHVTSGSMFFAIDDDGNLCLKREDDATVENPLKKIFQVYWNDEFGAETEIEPSLLSNQTVVKVKLPPSQTHNDKDNFHDQGASWKVLSKRQTISHGSEISILEGKKNIRFIDPLQTVLCNNNISHSNVKNHESKSDSALPTTNNQSPFSNSQLEEEEEEEEEYNHLYSEEDEDYCHSQLSNSPCNKIFSVPSPPHSGKEELESEFDNVENELKDDHLESFESSFNPKSSRVSTQPSIIIIGTETLKDYDLYVIRVFAGCDSWTVRRRFSELYSLFKCYAKIVPFHINGYFPARIPFGLARNAAVLANRVSALQQYLTALLFWLSHQPACSFYSGPNGRGWSFQTSPIDKASFVKQLPILDDTEM